MNDIFAGVLTVLFYEVRLYSGRLNSRHTSSRMLDMGSRSCCCRRLVARMLRLGVPALVYFSSGGIMSASPCPQVVTYLYYSNPKPGLRIWFANCFKIGLTASLLADAAKLGS